MENTCLNDYEFFDRFVKKFKEKFNIGRKLEIKNNKLKIYNNIITALDVGCARGELVKAFNDNGIKCKGIDKDANYKYCFKVDLDKDKFPFENNTFDLITCFGTIEYLKDDSLCINEIKRCLKPNGLFVLYSVFKETDRIKDAKARVNIHDRKYWINRFINNDFDYLKKLFYIGYYPWYKKIARVFVKSNYGGLIFKKNEA